MRHKSFQSLLGFLMRCDPIYTSNCYASHTVSIPAGFSDALRHIANVEKRVSVRVSIPAGFSDALRHIYGVSDTADAVSIPAGFSDALRLFGIRFYVP